jgi:hypothetical protein
MACAGNPEAVIPDFGPEIGQLYPFTLNEKLTVITEPSPWYTADGGASSPWGRAIIPMEMISVLTQYTSGLAGFRTKGPIGKI